jgi:hypothetical protein
VVQDPAAGVGDRNGSLSLGEGEGWGEGGVPLAPWASGRAGRSPTGRRRGSNSARRPLGETKLRDVTPDRVAVWSQGNEQALAPSTAWLARIALNQICRYAVRRGWLGVNPVAQLEPG